MDDPTTFNSTIQQYEDAYVRVNMVRAPPNAIDGPRNAILSQLDRLQTIVDSENSEIKNFADTSRLRQAGMVDTASEARDLRTARPAATDEYTLTKKIVGDTPPVPDWSPLYRRIGIASGLLIGVLGLRLLRV
jgi:hypothetical protein